MRALTSILKSASGRTIGSTPQVRFHYSIIVCNGDNNGCSHLVTNWRHEWYPSCEEEAGRSGVGHCREFQCSSLSPGPSCSPAG
jgi:hypothetical protein